MAVRERRTVIIPPAQRTAAVHRGLAETDLVTLGVLALEEIGERVDEVRRARDRRRRRRRFRLS